MYTRWSCISPILQVGMHVLGDQIRILQFTNYMYFFYSKSLVFRNTPVHRVASHIGIPSRCTGVLGSDVLG